ncbi:MAG: hypothetical protein A2756_01670 [Candidatus Ryanbacteria bacterium RIFCSPHIGHO2_01_FULL_48_27]|uniref:Uncharacterized protein n=1 Tax=Candidatus Ryanbacteria bacterium RIFCSPHIGHO2_01_FULL_48_27 TaxID=1802115 RepID=A0A1G2G4H4_9BACT|nr:MAG: hypothetical protein A2756_01670 [Candidatus Ryanbacteria bacterium RIFCSPHIGHO2_01_FULL_48_27]
MKLIPVTVRSGQALSIITILLFVATAIFAVKGWWLVVWIAAALDAAAAVRLVRMLRQLEKELELP